ncbi:hypothetical protein NUACC21_22090 [Scytonema sp. NUACC21]
MKLIDRTITSVAVVTTLTIFIPKVKAADYTLPIKQAADATGVTAARDLFGVEGSGITIGVISDSFNTSEISFDSAGNADNYATNIAKGYLPAAINVLQDFPDPNPGVNAEYDPTDEGRALLQTIHAIAPKANLAFYATPNARLPNASPEDLAGFGNAVRALAAAGADIIVDDIFFFNEPEPPEGAINQAITEVFNQGVAYFSANGNDYPFLPAFGHTNNSGAASVGAVYYGNQEISPIDGVTRQGQLESFSSAGQAGSIKPDFVAPDGLDISFNHAQAFPVNSDTGLYPFFGSSQAAPFAAAVAALLLEAAPNTSPSELYKVLRDTAQPLKGQIGFDNRSGYGLIQADKALLALRAQPVPEPGNVSALVAIGLFGGVALLKRRRFHWGFTESFGTLTGIKKVNGKI